MTLVNMPHDYNSHVAHRIAKFKVLITTKVIKCDIYRLGGPNLAKYHFYHHYISIEVAILTFRHKTILIMIIRVAWHIERLNLKL